MASNSRIQQHLSNLIPSSNTTTLDQEMDEFKKEQTNAMLKSLNSNESPIKEKHLRTLLIGSFRLKNSESFWVTLRDVVPLHGNELVVWKIPILTHRLFFDGHPNYTKSSISQKKWLIDLGNTWRHIGTGYGTLIHNYCELLTKKIDLHTGHSNIIPSGNFMVKNDSQALGNDFYIYEVCVDLFDYQDKLLNFINSVLETFDALKSNSVSSSAQCRLSPLITCINESHKIMEISTSFLAKVYKKLPPDSLEGHVLRYNEIYNGLKAFYDRCSTLTYFLGLVNVPQMPKNPPSFISSYNSKEEEQITNGEDKQLALIDHPNQIKQEELKLFVILEELDRQSSRCHTLECALKEKEEENSFLKAEITRSEETITNQKSDFITSFEKYRNKQEEEKELIKKQFSESAKIDNKVEESNSKLMKLKEMYQKLRKEHIELLRNNAELQKSMSKNQDMSKQDVEKMRSKIYDFLRDSSLRKIISDNFEEEDDITSPLEECFKSFKDKLEETDSELENYRDKNTILEKELLDKNSINANISLENTRLISHRDNLEVAIQKLTGEREALKELSDELMISRDSMKVQLDSNNDFVNRFKDKLLCIVERPEWSVQNCVDEIQHSKVSLEGDSEIARLLSLLFVLLSASKGSKNSRLYDKVAELIRSFLLQEFDSEKMINFLQDLDFIEDESDDELSVEDLDSMFSKEISEMEKSIAAASETMNKLLLETRSKYSGDKLEYNTQIIDSCSSLVEAVRNLIAVSKDLQNEITLLYGVESKEYYKKNHRWTQGLISAARAVGAGANFLMTSADEVARRDFNAKFESLIAASQEVAASTAQIVIASKVKADPKSDNLKTLTSRSKLVTEATAKVIAVCRTTSQIREDEKDLDFSSLTPHQTKLLEMETQVKVLELESDLEKERKKLFEYRKLHYKHNE
ncbi:huntingtin-interacting protein 1 [Lepeophtheirus salmonis]|uniref:huntingtin-interacting protein 1 n=1 Tax=Lepeophtheirus salmonis TaxID=72036 RepID=UPI001AE309C3|nr:huntingtin-interacting protein 1-like [Lepeophtheirus salmonis]